MQGGRHPHRQRARMLHAEVRRGKGEMMGHGAATEDAERVFGPIPATRPEACFQCGSPCDLVPRSNQK